MSLWFLFPAKQIPYDYVIFLFPICGSVSITDFVSRSLLSSLTYNMTYSNATSAGGGNFKRKISREKVRKYAFDQEKKSKMQEKTHKHIDDQELIANFKTLLFSLMNFHLCGSTDFYIGRYILDFVVCKTTGTSDAKETSSPRSDRRSLR